MSSSKSAKFNERKCLVYLRIVNRWHRFIMIENRNKQFILRVQIYHLFLLICVYWSNTRIRIKTFIFIFLVCQVAARQQHPSKFYTSAQGPAGASPSCNRAEGTVTPWTSQQFIAGPREQTTCTHGQVSSQSDFWTAGGSWRAWPGPR